MVTIVLQTLNDIVRKYYLDENELVIVNYHEMIKAKDIRKGYAYLDGLVVEVY